MTEQRTISTALAAAAAVAAAVALVTVTAASEAVPRFLPAPVPDAVPPHPPNETACQYQAAQPSLIRSSYRPLGKITRAEQVARSRLHRKAIRYRTKRYGFFEGFGQPQWNRRTPTQLSRWTTFMGLKVRMNNSVIPALACVEEQLGRKCSATPYRPQRVAGLRQENTFRSREVSNHVYGIAIDIDPSLNLCCGCQRRWWRGHSCRQPAESIYDRMAMPECWVHVFERFGFYWLGRDPLQDTMHFEFLGDPDRVTRTD